MKKINLLLIVSILVFSGWSSTRKDHIGAYRVVDFHQHTAFTDGSTTFDYLLEQGVKYGVDVMVNSEHGGGFSPRNASVGESYVFIPTWVEYGLKPEDFKGDPNPAKTTEGHQCMWRWQCIKEYSYKKVWEWNQKGTATLAIQGLEWNPPGHEHASVGIITEQFDATRPNADAVAQFEYMFDAGDNDATGGKEFGWVKSTKSGKEKTREGVEWLRIHHPNTSWMVPAHPERQNKWHINDYRDLNDIDPDIGVAFEGIPGRQGATGFRGFGNVASYEKSYTFGGVGVHAAKVGGVWDALISEGRRFSLVANTDFHGHISKKGYYATSCFYPGEYHKTYVFMKEKTAQSFVDGLRSGNIYCVLGDLIDRLEFSAGDATMGETYQAKGKTVKIRILVRDPDTDNNNTWSDMTNPVLHHIDLIAGEMRPKVVKDTDEYLAGKYDKVKVIARFDATGGITDANGITSIKWKDLGGGVKLIEHKVKITGDIYFRLRGTNHGLDAAGETDANGNPLEDVLNSAAIAFEDLWFYSNSIFVRK